MLLPLPLVAGGGVPDGFEQPAKDRAKPAMANDKIRRMNPSVRECQAARL
jgi:hypothetical protein